MYGLVKGVKYQTRGYSSPKDWSLIDANRRFSMQELSVLVQLPRIPSEYISYFISRLKATVKDAEVAGMGNRKLIATGLLEEMQKLGQLYAEEDKAIRDLGYEVTNPTPGVESLLAQEVVA